MEPTALEQAESVDMLRVLEHGHRVRLVETPFNTHAVDTPADLAFVESLMAQDPLTAQYLAKQHERHLDEMEGPRLGALYAAGSR